MIGIVFTGHIQFATGIQSAVTAITGKAPNTAFINFTEDLSPEQLEEKLAQAAKEVDQGEGVLFLTDLFGGTPNNCCVKLLMQNDNYEVVSGSNLSMVITAVLERDNFNLAELIEQLTDPAIAQIKNMRPIVKECSIKDGCTDCSDDGI